MIFKGVEMSTMLFTILFLIAAFLTMMGLFKLQEYLAEKLKILRLKFNGNWHKAYICPECEEHIYWDLSKRPDICPECATSLDNYDSYVAVRWGKEEKEWIIGGIKEY